MSRSGGYVMVERTTVPACRLSEQIPYAKTVPVLSRLILPGAIAVDKQGNLYVCDTGNNRILRYPAPFNQNGDLLQVDLVIGQKNVSTGSSPNEGNTAPSAKTIAFSSGNSVFQTGLAFDPQGNLWVSDPVNNRVLRFPAASLAPNTPEPAADIVLGQVDFVTGTLASTNRTQMNPGVTVVPAGLAFD